MFAKTIVESDAFLEMPLSTQALYFHIGMIADDDGFVGGPRRLIRNIGAAEDDLKILIAKRFVIPFETGVLVVKHWKMNNYIQKDRYKPTPYEDEKRLLSVKENQAYTLEAPAERPAALEEPENRSNSNADTGCIHDVYISDTDCIPRLGKDRDRVRLGQDSIWNEGMNNKDSACARTPARERARESRFVGEPHPDVNSDEWMNEHADIMERFWGPDWRSKVNQAQTKEWVDVAKNLRHPEWL